jgi:DHA2 family multidrug resistance protein
VLSVALYHMSRTIYPGMDFHTAMMLRIYQSVGLAFLFVPINTIGYTGVPPSKSNQVSGILNLSRNMGGDIGISMVTTLIARRSQWHQANLVANVRPGDPMLLERLQGIAQAAQHAGVSAAQSTKVATAAIYRQVTIQAQTLAYLDVLFILACFTAVMVPLVLLTRRAARGAAMAH